MGQENFSNEFFKNFEVNIWNAKSSRIETNSKMYKISYKVNVKPVSELKTNKNKTIE